MADTTVTNVGGDVPLEDTDNLSETQLRKLFAATNLMDYVVQGCGFSVDFGANTVTIGNTDTRGNKVHIESSDNLGYILEPDQQTGISLPDTNGVNHVYIEYDDTNNEIDYHIDTEDTSNESISLKIGEIDTSSNTSTELNRGPDGQFDTVAILDTNRETLSADKTLFDNSSQLQVLDPGGALRNVTLPANSTKQSFTIANNADADEDLQLRNNLSTDLILVKQDEVGNVQSDGSGWVVWNSTGVVN